MWQNAGLCGVDPWYRGIIWEASSTETDTEYIQKWMNKELIWPPSLEPYALQDPPQHIIHGAKSRREVLREKGVYKAAKTISNSGVRVAWPGLSNPSKVKVKEGEVMGVGIVPVNELSI